jgi:hypothetical protein
VVPSAPVLVLGVAGRLVVLLLLSTLLLGVQLAQGGTVEAATETTLRPGSHAQVEGRYEADHRDGGATITGTDWTSRRRCDVDVPASRSLKRVMASRPAGTTFCLSAGTFEVIAPIETQRGDRVIGAGRNATFIDGTGLPQKAEGIFLTDSINYFARLDIFGAPTPKAGSGVYCDGKSNCGKAFSIRGSSLTLRSVDCHDNGGNCIGGGGSANITARGLNCWKNGNAYSMTLEFRFAACIKRVAGYDKGNDTIVVDSYIHDNPWVGLWCDHCTYGLFDVEDSRLVHNGANGIQWEMSGGWTSDDRAIVRNNVIRRNNYLEEASFRGGVGVSTANDILVSGNSFGQNEIAGVNVIYTGSRDAPQPNSRGVTIQNNEMNSDDIRGCGLDGVMCKNND